MIISKDQYVIDTDYFHNIKLNDYKGYSVKLIEKNAKIYIQLMVTDPDFKKLSHTYEIEDKTISIDNGEFLIEIIADDILDIFINAVTQSRMINQDIESYIANHTQNLLGFYGLNNETIVKIKLYDDDNNIVNIINNLYNCNTINYNNENTKVRNILGNSIQKATTYRYIASIKDFPKEITGILDLSLNKNATCINKKTVKISNNDNLTKNYIIDYSVQEEILVEDSKSLLVEFKKVNEFTGLDELM